MYSPTKGKSRERDDEISKMYLIKKLVTLIDTMCLRTQVLFIQLGLHP